jgi:hypothetical protein
MTFNLPNLREAKPAAMSKASSESTPQPSRSSTDSSFMDEKEAHVTWAEVNENNSKTKPSKLSRIVQGQYIASGAAHQYY